MAVIAASSVSGSDSVIARVPTIAALSMSLMVAVLVSSQPARSQGADQFVSMNTTKGRIVIRVFRSIVPYTADNFLDLVSRGFYDGLTFHRVENWVAQGGDPLGNGTGNFVDPDTGKPRLLRLEVNQRLGHNQPGMVAMARNANPNSASCQFYFLKKPMPQLNGQYAVFGRVVQGMNSVYALQIGDRILGATVIQRDSGGGGNGSGRGGGGGNGGFSSSDQAVPGVPDSAAPVQRDTTKLPPGESGF